LLRCLQRELLLVELADGLQVVGVLNQVVAKQRADAVLCCALCLPDCTRPTPY